MVLEFCSRLSDHVEDEHSEGSLGQLLEDRHSGRVWKSLQETGAFSGHCGRLDCTVGIELKGALWDTEAGWGYYTGLEALQEAPWH